MGTERTPDKRRHYKSELAGMRESNEESSYREETLDHEHILGHVGVGVKMVPVENARISGMPAVWNGRG